MRKAIVVTALGLHLATVALSPSLTADSPPAAARPVPRLGGEARAWVASRGGLIEQHPRHAGMQRIVDELAQAAGLEPVTLWIVDNAAPAASAAPPNDVFFNAGLIDLTSDAELAAVIAHELAHLVERHDCGVFHQLDGRHRALDEEARADALGLLILDRAGHDPRTMLAVMTKVRDHLGGKDPAWSVIHQRILTLRHTVAALFPPEVLETPETPQAPENAAAPRG